jgi:hypothetical protein
VSQRVRLTRLDVILILILVAIGASAWPVTSELLAVSRQDGAPREVDYQFGAGVQALRVRLKGFEDQLAKVREKVVEKRLDAKTDPADLERIQNLAKAAEDTVLGTTLDLARAESTAARAYSRDLKWHQWKTLGVTVLAAGAIDIVVIALFVLLARPLLALARVTPSWSRVLPVSAVVILITIGYQAGQVSGLIALVVLVTVGSAVSLLVTSLLRRDAQTAQS